jgi:rhodanese-related sulfurtransferase
VYVQSRNEAFTSQVSAAFPEKSAKILVACSDGRTRASAAVDILQAGGYTNAVGRGVNRQWLVVYVVVQGKR